ncbi:MAG: NADH:flavin oxidoreductase [Deltaproteobacteria bacterium]|nr:NADH:flavin oxidoreductase [Deltaproteobacteria bacterium]
MMLFEPFTIKALKLKNRITMTPLFLGYANPDGTPSQLLIDHYKEMASSGVAMVVVENIAVDVRGMGSPFMLRADEDKYVEGLSLLSKTIKDQGVIAFAQINHAGRYAYHSERVAPSPVKTGEVVPQELTADEIEGTIESFAKAAKRIKEAGFDGVELHGGTGYLLVQFLSPRTNHRTDEYGGVLANRMRFPLRVVEGVMDAVGQDFPVGYRFLADEMLPDGFQVEEATIYGAELARKEIAYLSVMVGTYDSFSLPKYREMEREQGYMVHFAHEVKKSVQGIPVIAAGRIQGPEYASKIIDEGKADLIGIARVLFADPLWPKKAKGEIQDPIIGCEPTCSLSLCMQRLMKGKPAYCSQWSKERREAFLKRVEETG